MAQPGAVIDVVMAKALTDHLLKQIGFFIGAFGAAKARHFAPAPFEALCCKVQRLLPRRLAKNLAPISGIDIQPLGGRIFAADQWFGQAVIVVDIVKAKAAFDAEPPFVRRAVDALDVLDLVVLHLQRNLATHAAEGADALNLAVVIRAITHLLLIHHRGRHQRPRRAGLNAFTTGHTGRCAHGIVDVKHRVGIMPAPGHANHVVDLHFAASAYAKVALDTRIKVDPHRDMAIVQQRNAVPLQLGKTAALHPAQGRHVAHVARLVMGHILRGLVCQQQFHHHLAGILGARIVGGHHHAIGRLTDAGRRQHALTLNLNHTGAAVAVGAIAGGGFVAQMRDFKTPTIGHFPNGHASLCLNGLPIKRECDPLGHGYPSR